MKTDAFKIFLCRLNQAESSVVHAALVVKVLEARLNAQEKAVESVVGCLDEDEHENDDILTY